MKSHTPLKLLAVTMILLFLPLLVTANNPPTQTTSFVNYELDYFDTIYLSMGSFFTDYDSVRLEFSDNLASQSVLIDAVKGGTNQFYTTDHIWVTAYTFDTNIIWAISSSNTDFTTNDLKFTAFNTNGNTPSTPVSLTIAESVEAGGGTGGTGGGDPPAILQTFENQVIGYNDNLFFNLNNWFSNYDSVSLTIQDTIASQNPVITTTKTSIDAQATFEDYQTVYIDALITPLSNNIYLNIESLTTDLTFTMTVRAFNDNGFTERTFTLTVDEEAGDPVTPPPVGGLDITSLNNKLISYYNLDENTGTIATDSKGNNHGTITGTTWTTGKINTGLLFDALSEKIILSNENNFDFERTEPFSVSFWAQQNSLPTTNFYINKQTPSGAFTGWVIWQNGNNMQIDITGTTSNNKLSEAFDISTLTGLNFYTITYDGSVTNNGLKLYVNSQEVTTISNTNTLTTSILNDIPVEIGNRNGAFNFNGIIDEVGIYNNILTPDEVSFLYAEGNPTANQQYQFVSTTPEPPTQTTSFSNIQLNDNSDTTLTMSNFFNGFNAVRVEFTNSFDQAESVLIDIETGATLSSYTVTSNAEDFLRFDFVPSGNDVNIVINSFGVEGVINDLKFTALNNDGFIAGETISVTVESVVLPVTQVLGIPMVLLEHTDQQILDMNNYFNNYETIEISFTANEGNYIISNRQEDDQSINLIPTNDLFEVIIAENNGVTVTFNSGTTSLNQVFTIKAINSVSQVEDQITLQIFQEPPEVITTLTDTTRSVNQAYEVFMNNIFLYANTYTLNYKTSLNNFETTQTLQFNNDVSLNNDNVNINFKVLEGLQTLRMTSTEDFTVKYTITATNQFGSVTTNEAVVTFQQPPPTPLGKLSNQILGFLPNSEDISTSQGLIITVIIMLIATVILGFGMSNSGGISNISVSLIVVINMLILITMTALGFIAMWIIIILIITAISYLLLPFLTNGGS